MQDTITSTIKKAKSVLNRNRSGAYTLPSSTLYPHQWNWDSGFISIGYSHYDTEMAISEIKSLFDAQWHNGMVPQIVFNRDRLGKYFPEPDFWRTDLSPHSPEELLTSGITMPPIHAYAVLKIYENADNKVRVREFLRWIYPRLLSFHRYLYNERNINGDGLIYIRHPWESGMDNSPAWDVPLDKIDLSTIEIPDYQRKDTESGVSPDMRPTKKYYDYFVYLIELYKKTKYDEREIAKECPFIISGPLFNAILCASNEALISIGEILNEQNGEIEEWYRLTARSISEKLFNDKQGIFDALDLRTNKLIELETASGFLPLFGGAATADQASRIYEYLDSRGFCALHQGNCFTIPSYDSQSEQFKRENYWRGPVWININWMLVQGLRRYGYTQRADSLAHDILELPMRFGFYEYYDSFDGRGYGSEDFSWTAALFLDIAYETYIKTGNDKIPAWSTVRLIKVRTLNSAEIKKKLPLEEISQEMARSIKSIKGKYYRSNGKVDYESIKTSGEYAEYRNIAASLRELNPECLVKREEKLAFWINLYNTIVVDAIIEAGIKSSVKEMRGFFTNLKYDIGGHLFSPDDIEHGILRANRRKPSLPWRQFGPLNGKKVFSLERLDPRIHFALVCGSRSCAPIEYYTAENIDAELDLASKNFINSSEVIVIPEENRLLISQIFKWYESDFEGMKGIKEFLGKYIIDDDKREFIEMDYNRITIEYLYYDWNLNK